MNSQAFPRVSAQQAATFLLSRQGLSVPFSSPVDTAKRLVAIQSQYRASVPVALWARQPTLRMEQVNDALLRRRSLVKTWTIRHTLHAVASSDLALLTASVGAKLLREYNYNIQYSEAERASLDQRILRALADGPLNRAQIQERIPELKDSKYLGWGWDIKGLAFQGKLVFAQQAGGDSSFAKRDIWLKRTAWNPPAEQSADRQLFLRYLAGYGPASLRDYTYWSGLKKRDVGGLIQLCERDIAGVLVDDWPDIQYVRKRDLPALLSLQTGLPEVAVLPKFDVLLLGHRSKARLIDEKHYKAVFRKAGQIEAVVLFHGRICATWRSKAGRSLDVSLQPLGRLTKKELQQVERRFAELARFLGSEDLRLQIVDKHG